MGDAIPIAQEKSVQNSSESKNTNKRARKPLNVLLVDLNPELAHEVERISGTKDPVRITHCRTLAEARNHAASGNIDLAVIHQELADGNGVDLARELSGSKILTKTIVVSDQASLDGAIQAIRAGASDFVDQSEGLQSCLGQMQARIEQLIDEQKLDKKKAGRVKRLRGIARQINDERLEVSEQVETLCSDLISAYQELAGQVSEAMKGTEYGKLVEGELDFEVLLRRTLEYLVKETGPTNAAVFLPATLDEYSLGGYVNYDCGADGAELLLQHLADVVAFKVAERQDLVALTDNQTLNHWFADDADWLIDQHMLAIACRKGDEVLAVLTVFRDASIPFDEKAVQSLEQIAPLLAQALAKVIRVHHRAMPESQIEGDWESEFGGEDAMPF